MKQSELKAILEDHKLWLESHGKQGKHANLQDADLVGANLRGAHLRGADLMGANLPGAKFTTNFKKVHWFEHATFSEDQIPWVALHPRYPKWADTLKWVKVKADAA